MNERSNEPRGVERAAALADWYESLTPTSLDSLEQWYTPQARFKDPFNDVCGTAAIRQVFEHMFRTLDAPRFVVVQTLLADSSACLCWEFHFRFRGESAPRLIVGNSVLKFDPDGRVCEHRDYWDAAEELYEKLPVVGALMRWLRRRARGN